LFLASVENGEEVGLKPLFGDTLSTAGIGVHNPGFVPREGGAVVRHPYGETVSLIEIDCTGEVTGMVEVPGAAIGRRALRDPSATTASVSIGTGSTVQAGLGAVAEYAILADLVVPWRDDPVSTHRTVLHIVRDGALRDAVRIRGQFVILDSRPGVGLLVSVYEPYPRVFVVPEAELLPVLRRRW
jgi:hypothetical protein